MEKLAELLIEALERHGEVMTANEKELAEQNRQHLSEVEASDPQPGSLYAGESGFEHGTGS